jgi:glycogen debranching enzyme
MANALGMTGEAGQARRRAEAIATRFDADWWDEAGGTYAMSLKEPGNALYPVPHWAVIIPLEAGLATPEHAARTFETLRAGYLNRWGLKHTRGDDERVWTLPTATLSRAAYRYNDPEMGFQMLGLVSKTLEHGAIGLFHELIPEGACFVQLWSAAVFIRGVVEDLLGIQVRVAEHTIHVSPRLPAGWEEVALENLCFGEHCVTVRVGKSGIHLIHKAGQHPLTVWAGEEQITLPAA